MTTEPPIIAKPAWPHYAFGRYAGPVHRVFAWYPVRLWYGRWTWLRPVLRMRVLKISTLPGPDWKFWCYNDMPSAIQSDIQIETQSGISLGRSESAQGEHPHDS